MAADKCDFADFALEMWSTKVLYFVGYRIETCVQISTTLRWGDFVWGIPGFSLPRVMGRNDMFTCLATWARYYT